MIIKLVWSGSELQALSALVGECLSDLHLTDLVTLETTDDPAYKMELGITANPALCIEESTIDFKDMIFEGLIPEKSELTSMFVSILWTEEGSGGSCGTGWCGTCSTGCWTENHAHA